MSLNFFPIFSAILSTALFASLIPLKSILPEPAPTSEAVLSSESPKLNVFISSKPAKAFLAFLAAVTASSPASAIPAPNDAASVVPPDNADSIPSLFISPLVKLLNALATVCSLPRSIFNPFKMGVKTFIKPCPSVAFKLSNRRLSTLVWFAQLS